MPCTRHGRGFFLSSGIITVFAMTLLAISLGTQKWIEADLIRKYQQNALNSSAAYYNAGYKYLGIFRGCEQKTYGNYFVTRNRCFNAFTEMKEIAKSDFAYANVTMICICVALLTMIVYVYIAIYNDLVRSVPGYLHVTIPCISSSSSIILKTLALGAYLYIYNKSLKKSLLSREDEADGFSTNGRANLGYSFWLLVASLILSILSLVILCISLLRGKMTSLFRTNVSKKTQENAVPMQHQRNADGAGMMIF